jgi:OOP family OmpA-OmpF porin
MNKKIKALLAFTAVCVSSLASAQWYVGGAVGISSTILSSGTISGAISTTETKHQDDTGYKAQLGYQFNKYFALEGGYVNLGKFYTTTNGTFPGPATGSGSSEINTDGWNLLAVGLLPVSKDFTLLGKIGVYASTTTRTSSTTGVVILRGPASISNSATDSTYGFGVQYDISKALLVRGEAESFEHLSPNSAISGGNVKLYSVSLIYKL